MPKLFSQSLKVVGESHFLKWSVHAWDPQSGFSSSTSAGNFAWMISIPSIRASSQTLPELSQGSASTAAAFCGACLGCSECIEPSFLTSSVCSGRAGICRPRSEAGRDLSLGTDNAALVSLQEMPRPNRLRPVFRRPGSTWRRLKALWTFSGIENCEDHPHGSMRPRERHLPCSALMLWPMLHKLCKNSLHFRVLNSTNNGFTALQLRFVGKNLGPRPQAAHDQASPLADSRVARITSACRCSWQVNCPRCTWQGVGQVPQV